MNCINCNNLTNNPKFCSRSCSAAFNNTLYPKRKLTATCVTCGTPILKKGTKTCRSCPNLKSPGKMEKNWSVVTKGDLRGSTGTNNRTGRMPQIRRLARKWYEQSGKPMRCVICDYSVHVDICHIKDVKDFPDSAFVTEINDLDNLIAMCKNHHWEFDNGFLTL